MKNAIFLSKNNWLYLIFHPITLAFFVAFVSAWFIFPEFEGYKSELISKEQSSSQTNIIYADLNQDGNSECITASYFHHENMPGISIFSHNGKVYDQWNLKGEFFEENRVFTGDYNENKSKEIYVFTREKDSVFLNALEFFTKNGLELKRHFITKTKAFNDHHYDIEILEGRFFDVNDDGAKEFVFYLYAGYGLQPRNLFVYDIENDSLIVSPKSGSGLKYAVQFFDMDKDGVPEVTGIAHAPYNFHQPIPYPDSLSWLFVYKTNGSFLFEPFPVQGLHTQIASTFIQAANEVYVLALINYRVGSNLESNFKLILVNSKGEIVKEKYIQDPSVLTTSHEVGFFKLQEEKWPYLYFNDKSICFVDSSLNLEKLKISKLNKWEHLQWKGFCELDIDGDGAQEQLFKTNNSSVRVFRDGMAKSLAVEVFSGKGFIPSLKFENGKPTLLSISNTDFQLLYSYYKNPKAWLKFPIVLLLFISSYLLFYFLVKIQKNRIENQFKEEKQLHKYQYQGLRNQLDPHFALNILNAIQSLFYQKDFDKTKSLLSKYGKLNRNALLNAEKIAISLEDELDFVENFLALEKFRYEERFDYFIKVDKMIDAELIWIPRMLIHTFAENAIKHGLFPKSEGGFLKIEVKESESNLQIIIEDNGIGRARSKDLKTLNNGKGLSIIQEIVKLYNKLQKAEISYKTIDLFEENKALGTRVEVLIPTKK